MLNIPSRDERLQTYLPLWGTWLIDKPIYLKDNSAVYLIHKNGINKEIYGVLKIVTITTDDAETEISAKDYLNKQLEKSKQEIFLLNKIKQHKNIVSYYNDDIKPIKDINKNLVGYDVLISMEYLTCFTNIMDTKKSFTQDEIVRFAIDICNALKHLHNNGIIHRDIKPANIFMDKYGNYKLGDLGASKLMNSSNVVKTAVCTKPYGAPEIFQFKPYTIQADIYSLGIVLYRLANDYKYPFTDDLSMESMENSISKRLSGIKLPTPSMNAPKLTRIILKACEFEPKNRYATINDMLLDLTNLSKTNKIATITEKNTPIQESTIAPPTTEEHIGFANLLLNKFKNITNKKKSTIEPNIQNALIENERKSSSTEIIIGKQQAIVDFKSEKNICIDVNGSILAEAFENFFNLETLTIKNGITSIGDKAFKDCLNLKSVILPNTLKNLGNDVFNGCSSLETIELSNSLTAINDNTFYGCSSLEKIKIPNGVTSIGKFAFFLCSKLKEIQIPDTVTTIGFNAFPRNSQLIIKCNVNSDIHFYCVKNKIQFELLN